MPCSFETVRRYNLSFPASCLVQFCLGRACNLETKSSCSLGLCILTCSARPVIVLSGCLLPATWPWHVPHSMCRRCRQLYPTTHSYSFPHSHFPLAPRTPSPRYLPHSCHQNASYLVTRTTLPSTPAVWHQHPVQRSKANISRRPRYHHYQQ
jgi:hypothetical protein